MIAEIIHEFDSDDLGVVGSSREMYEKRNKISYNTEYRCARSSL
jgi:hypothetical protein